MKFVAETILLVLEAVSVFAALYIVYFLALGRADEGSKRPRPPVIRSGGFFLLNAAVLAAAHYCIHREWLLSAITLLLAGWMTGAFYYFAAVPHHWKDNRIRYAILLWATYWLLSFFLLLLLWWASDRFDVVDDRFHLDAGAVVQIVNNVAQIVGIVIAAAMIVVTNMFNAEQAKKPRGSRSIRRWNCNRSGCSSSRPIIPSWSRSSGFPATGFPRKAESTPPPCANIWCTNMSARC